MVKFEWTNKVLSAINVSTEWSDDVRGRVSQILSEFNEAQNSTSSNKQSTPCSECGADVFLNDILCSDCFAVAT